MALTSRQQLAKSLTEYLRWHGAWATSPLPLRDGDRLRFACRTMDAAEMTGKLAAMGFNVSYCGSDLLMRPRTMTEPPGPVACSTFEIALPRGKKAAPQHRELTTAEDKVSHRRHGTFATEPGEVAPV
jgi:hypothetical protein